MLLAIGVEIGLGLGLGLDLVFGGVGLGLGYLTLPNPTPDPSPSPNPNLTFDVIHEALVRCCAAVDIKVSSCLDKAGDVGELNGSIGHVLISTAIGSLDEDNGP